MAASADQTTMATADNNPLMVTDHIPVVANGVNAATPAVTAAVGESSRVLKPGGRRKIEMRKIKKSNYLQVAFAKRRPGLVKKASELSTLCGAEVGLLVFSPAGKPSTFGHPDFEKVVDCFLGEAPSSSEEEVHDVTNELICAELAEKLSDLREQLSEVNDQAEHLDSKEKTVHNSANWWENPIDDLDINELQYMTQSLLWIGERAQGIVLNSMNQGFSDPNFEPYLGDFSSHPAVHNNVWFDSGSGGGIPSSHHQAVHNNVWFDSGSGGGIPSSHHQAIPNYASNVAAPAAYPTGGANGYGAGAP